MVPAQLLERRAVCTNITVLRQNWVFLVYSSSSTRKSLRINSPLAVSFFYPLSFLFFLIFLIDLRKLMQELDAAEARAHLSAAAYRADIKTLHYRADQISAVLLYWLGMENTGTFARLLCNNSDAVLDRIKRQLWKVYDLQPVSGNSIDIHQLVAALGLPSLREMLDSVAPSPPVAGPSSTSFSDYHLVGKTISVPTRFSRRVPDAAEDSDGVAAGDALPSDEEILGMFFSSSLFLSV